MGRLNRLILAVVMAMALGSALAACGKKGPPELPEGVSDDYPRKYPSE